MKSIAIACVLGAALFAAGSASAGGYGRWGDRPAWYEQPAEAPVIERRWERPREFHPRHVRDGYDRREVVVVERVEAPRPAPTYVVVVTPPRPTPQVVAPTSLSIEAQEVRPIAPVRTTVTSVKVRHVARRTVVKTAKAKVEACVPVATTKVVHASARTPLLR